MPADFELMKKIANEDVAHLKTKERSYGDSWMKRGGVDSFMMLARKWDRIEHQVGTEFNFNVLDACTQSYDKDGILDDVGDLRRYLLLLETEVIRRMGENADEGEADGRYVNQGTD